MPLTEASPVEVHRLSGEDVRGIREALEGETRTPRILCWNCKKLTPFHEERCEYCGARFAGSTGGVYAKARPPARSVVDEDEELAEARRSLLQLFEDLQRVHDVSSRRRYDPVRDEESVTLFQCPSCGRFVSEDAVDCLCGVHFAAEAETAVCPKCGAHVPQSEGICPVCRASLGSAESDVLYACPLCGAEVTADAVRCTCGARFEG